MIPDTSKTNYLTGITALNIPSLNGTGDWHFVETFQGFGGRSASRYFVSGVNSVDVSAVLGVEGIINCADILGKYRANGVKEEVYAANHYRAAAELILNTVIQGWPLPSLGDLQGWFSGQDDKDNIYMFLKKAIDILSEEDKDRVLVWFQGLDI